MLVAPLALQPLPLANRPRFIEALPAANPIVGLATDEVEVICTDPTTGEQRTATGHLAAVDGRVYLRPRGGRRCAWARGVAGGECLAIATPTGPVPVTAVLVRDDAAQHRVTEALLCRFGYDPAMPRLLEDASIAATVELVPAGAAAPSTLAA